MMISPTRLVLLVASMSAPALLGQTMTLPEAVGMALAADPTLAVSVAERDEAEAALQETRAGRDPHLSISGSIFQYEEPMVVSPIHGFTPGRLPDFDRTLVQSALTSTWLLWDGGMTRARIRQAEALSAAAEHSIGEARQALILATVNAYLSVIAAGQALHAHDVRLQAIDSELQRVRLLEKAGKVPDVETYRAEAARAAAEADRTGAAADLDAAQHELARLIRVSPEQVRVTRLALPLPDTEDLMRARVESAAIEANDRVRRARLRADAQRAALAAARAARRPAVNAAGSVLEFGDGDGDFTAEWNAGLQVRFSILDGGAAQARVARAEAALRGAEAGVEAARDEVLRALDRTFTIIEQTGAAVRSLAAAEIQFSEVARVEKLRLDLGAGTQAEYLRAESDVLVTRAALARARHRAIAAGVELARISGALDAQWIVQHFRSLP